MKTIHIYAGRCVNSYGDQIKHEEHILRCTEQKVCNISYMHPNQKINMSHWYMKTGPPTCINADFECMNIPKDNDNQIDANEKLFLHKTIAIVYVKIKNSE